MRDAIDHGLEAPAERTAAGKPVEGTLMLKAYHESGQVVVEVTDDGKGMDPVRVGDKAVEKGLVTRDQVGRMSDREILDLIFRPGFSTAEAVTNVSGRGVGWTSSAPTSRRSAARSTCRARSRGRRPSTSASR